MADHTFAFRRRLVVALRTLSDLGDNPDLQAAQILEYLTMKDAERLLAMLEKVADKWEEEYGIPTN
jgi:hypothetical protein